MASWPVQPCKGLYQGSPITSHRRTLPASAQVMGFQECEDPYSTSVSECSPFDASELSVASAVALVLEAGVAVPSF